ncbi:MAG: ribosome maturation factor RimM [bacterium]
MNDKVPEELITIGKVIKVHNNKGILKVYPVTDFPEHFKTLKEIFLVKAAAYSKVAVEKATFHKNLILLTISGWNSRTEAEKWRDATIAIEKKDLWPLGKNEYYYFDLIGLTVITDKGRELGKIREIFPTGSNDVYVVKNKEHEYMLPAIKDVVKKIDIEKGFILVHLLEGLIN